MVHSTFRSKIAGCPFIASWAAFHFFCPLPMASLSSSGASMASFLGALGGSEVLTAAEFRLVDVTKRHSSAAHHLVGGLSWIHPNWIQPIRSLLQGICSGRRIEQEPGKYPLQRKLCGFPFCFSQVSWSHTETLRLVEIPSLHILRSMSIDWDPSSGSQKDLL